MMRIAGRGDDGLAKTIKTDNEGNVGVQLASSKADIKMFNSQNPYANSSYHEIRDTNSKQVHLPQVEDGVIEQSVLILNTLDTELNVRFQVNFGSENGGKLGVIFYEVNVPINGRFAFMPEKSYHNESSGTFRNIELPELRMPIPRITMVIKANTLPTTGEFTYTTA